MNSLAIRDVVAFAIALNHLVNNALKFTRQGNVLVNVNLASSHGNQVQLVFSVTDTGIGIADDLQVHIFKAFDQADTSHARPYEGLGLGLYIAHEIATAHGGTIEVTSTKDETCFTFRMPINCKQVGAID